MESLDKYKIDLREMQSNVSTYEFLLNDEFFGLIDAPEVQKGNVKVTLEVKRVFHTFEFYFQIDGSVVVLCDRCLYEMTQNIHSDDRLIVKFGDEFQDDDDVIIVPEKDGFINIAWLIYEFIALAIPIKHVHADGECNQDMSKKLNELLCSSLDVRDVSMESGESESERNGKVTIDPRWNELKRLLDNN